MRKTFCMMVVWSSKKEAEYGEIRVTIVSSGEVRNLDFILGIVEYKPYKCFKCRRNTTHIRESTLGTWPGTGDMTGSDREFRRLPSNLDRR